MVRRLLPTAAIAVLLLSGCTAPSDPAPSPTPSAATPPYASEEEAVEAAEAALTRFLEVSDAIYQDGGDKADRIATVVTDEWRKESLKGFEEFANLGWRQQGNITFESTTHQQTFLAGKETRVIVLTCMDYSTRSMVDADGAAVDMSGIPPRRLFEIELATEDSEVLLVAGAEPWSPDEC